MENYEKSYKGFVIMVFLLLAFMLGASLLPSDLSLTMRLFFNGINLWLAILMYIIYKSEKVYWITGVTYEQAKSAGSERRKAYGKAHFDKFLHIALLFLALSSLWLVFKPPFGATAALFSIAELVLLLTGAFSTVKIKL